MIRGLPRRVRNQAGGHEQRHRVSTCGLPGKLPCGSFGTGVVARMRQPGGNATGFATKGDRGCGSPAGHARKCAAALGVQALGVPFDAVTNSHSRVINEQLIRHKLPAMFAGVAYVEGGGLMSCAAAFGDNFRRAASHVDKIFRGAKPGDLPVQQPTRFELVVNGKTAKAIGVAFPAGCL